MNWQNGDTLDTRPLTLLGNVLLLGGDASNDDVIDMMDAGCIGGGYGQAPSHLRRDGSTDVNGDGVVDILDLALMGGNYDLNASPWTSSAVRYRRPNPSLVLEPTPDLVLAVLSRGSAEIHFIPGINMFCPPESNSFT